MERQKRNFNDKHHVLHTRQEWDLRPESAALRASGPLIPLVDRQVHDEVHRIAPAVPLLSYYVLVRTLRLYEPQETTIASIDNLMGAIDVAAQHRRAHHVERGVADLAIEALSVQRAILRGNVIE